MNGTEILIDHFLKLRFEDLPESAVHAAKMRIIDSFGVLMAGVRGLGCDMVADMMKQWGGAQEATVLNYGYKLPAPNACMLNCLMLRSYDFEPVEAGYGTESVPAHVSGSTVPAAITAAEIRGKTGADFLTALILGDDFGARIAVSTGFDVHDCYDNTGTVNSLAAAAVAAKLYDLDAAQYKNALGIALNCAGGTMQNVFEGNMCFKLPMANAARNAIVSCEMAQRGYNSLEDPVTGDRAFYAMFAPSGDSRKLFADLGEKYYSDIVFKPYSSCRSTHSINDATLKATGGRRITADMIDTYKIIVPPGTLDFVGKEFPFGSSIQPQAAFNFRYTSATILLHGNVRPEWFQTEPMNDPELGRLLEKMEVIGDPAFPFRQGAKVTIKLKDGTVLEGLQELGTGDTVKTPLGDEKVIQKYMENALFSGTVTKETAEKLLDTVMHLEDVASFTDVIKLFGTNE